MVILRLRDDFDATQLGTGAFCLGYQHIALLFNAGPFPGGGNCLIVRADGEIIAVNSNDLIHDLEAYQLDESKM